MSYVVPVDPVAVVGRGEDHEAAGAYLDLWADAYVKAVEEGTGYRVSVQWADSMMHNRIRERENYPVKLEEELDNPTYAGKAAEALVKAIDEALR